MKKWKKGGRWIAAMLVTALLAGSLSGCGKAAGSGAGQSGESGAGKDSAESGGSSQGAQNEGSSGQGKGRYVEIQESLPQELLAAFSMLAQEPPEGAQEKGEETPAPQGQDK